MSTRTTAFLLGFGLVSVVAYAAIGEQRELPDDSITPGAIASHDVHEICGRTSGLTYSQAHRATSLELKHAIRARDGCDPRNSEVDHRVPLALGGADVKENLWCQPGVSTWNYHDKDKLEVYAWEAVCKHGATLDEAQRLFLGDWTKAYCGIFRDGRC